MQLLVENASDTATICPQGNIVMETEQELREVLRSMVTRGVRTLTLDLRHVEMMDSSGLGLLIATHNSLARKGGELRVLEAGPDLLNLLQMMRLHQHFTVQGTSEEP